MRTAIVLLVAVAVLAAAGVYGAVLLTREDPEPDATTSGRTWDSYTVKGRTLVVEATGDPCTELADVEVDESDDRVVVTMHVEVDGAVCAALAVPIRGRVRLEDPLGSRPVYDGACLDDEGAARGCRRGDD